MNLTVERLREVLRYEPGTGKFIRLVSNSNRARAGSITGSPAVDGSIVVHIDGKLYRAHRLAWLYVHGRWPVAEIDHVNGDPADNRVANLRESTRTENMRNVRMHRDCGSGLKGAYRDKKKWKSSIMVDGVHRYLGAFDPPEDAHAAYCRAATTLHGEFARFR